jgi:DNA topoisomerase-1
LGFTVNDLLVQFFPDLVNVSFTAEMEDELDRVATGEQAWVPMLHEFYGPFAETVEIAREQMPRIELEPEPTGDLCPECGEPLLIRLGRYGKFIGCSGWPDCRYTAALPLPGITCPECGGAVVEKRTRRGKRFYGCANYPACEWATWKKPKATKGMQEQDETGTIAQ